MGTVLLWVRDGRSEYSKTCIVEMGRVAWVGNWLEGCCHVNGPEVAGSLIWA